MHVAAGFGQAYATAEAPATHPQISDSIPPAHKLCRRCHVRSHYPLCNITSLESICSTVPCLVLSRPMPALSVSARAAVRGMCDSCGACSLMTSVY